MAANRDVALGTNVPVAPGPAFSTVILENNPQKVMLESHIYDQMRHTFTERCRHRYWWI
jgi:hypothetical protein